MTRPAVDALLFDFGGVIIEIDFDRVFARWAQHAGVRAAQVKERFSHGAAYQGHERGELEAADYFAALRAELGIALRQDAFADGWQQVFGDEIAPTVALLPKLAERVPLHLFSNTNRAHHAYWSKRYAAALAPFRRHFISCEMGLRKPDRAAFEHVAAELGVPIGRILFFDDTEANIVGARAAGLLAVHVPTPEDLRRAVAPWLA